MSVDGKLMKAASKLVLVANKGLDTAMPGRLAGIVKLHGALAVGAAWIPIPGVDLAGGAAAIWGMYYRINNELEVPFEENLIKSVASGVATNLAAGLGVVAVAQALKFFPGIGTLAGSIVLSAAAYALALASGYVYMRALTILLEQKQAGDITDSDLKDAVDKVMSDKESIDSFVNEAKASYKKEDVEAQMEQAKAAPPVPETPVEKPPIPFVLKVEPQTTEEEPALVIPVVMIRFVCASCNKKLKSPADRAGRISKCVFCGEKVVIPNE